jgi:hypothetical protein
MSARYASKDTVPLADHILTFGVEKISGTDKD